VIERYNPSALNLVYGTCVIVIGMHRSGTSVIAGTLSRMGVDFGERLLGPKADNPKGFYEHLDLLELDESILRRLNSSYDDELPLPHEWWKDSRFESYKQSIQDVIRRDFGTSPLFGFKDPRISILLPLYIDALAELGVRPKFVIATRSPGEIAESLRVRNGFSYAKSLALYTKHTDAIEKHTAGFERCRITMADFLADPRSCLERVRDELWIPLVPYESAAREIEAFVDPTLRHHTFDDAAFLARVLADHDTVVRELDTTKKQLADITEKESVARNNALRLEGIVALRDGEIKTRTAELTGEIQTLAAHLAEANTEHRRVVSAIAERDARIVELDARVIELNHTLAHRDERIRNLELVDARVIELDHTLAHRDERIRNLELETAEQMRFAIEADRLKHVVDSMERSVVWRIVRAVQRIVDVVAPEGTARSRAYYRFLRKIQGVAAQVTPREEVKPDTGFPVFSNVDVLFVNHEETLTGAPRIVFEIAKRTAQRCNVVVASKARGGMHREFVSTFGDNLIHPGELINECDRHILAARTIDAVAPRCVYVNSIVSYEYALEAKRRGIPTIMHVHEIGAAFDRAIERDYHPVFKDCADTFIAASQATYDYLVEHMGCAPESVEVVHEFVNGDAVRAAAARRRRTEIESELGISKNDVLVVAIGTFDRRKGADLFAKAAAKARKDGLRARFAWIGRGPHPYEGLIETLRDCGDALIHIPETPDPFPYLARADVFVLSSREDPFPLVVLEAMSLGIPVVAFERSGGAREALEHGVGELVSEFSVARLLERIEALVRDATIRKQLGARGVEAQKKFDAHAMLPAFDAVIDNVRAAHQTAVASPRATI
jgi:glycosyltransferase involved in cell wall biosynthesis